MGAIWDLRVDLYPLFQVIVCMKLPPTETTLRNQLSPLTLPSSHLHSALDDVLLTCWIPSRIPLPSGLNPISRRTPPPHGQVQPASRVRPSQSTPALDDRACAVLGTGEVKGWEGFPRTVRGRKEVPGPAKCPLDRSPKFFLGLPRDSAGVPSLAAGSFGEGMGFRWGLTLAARRRPGRSGQTPPSGPPPSPHPEASAPASARPGSAALPLPRPPRPLPAPPGLVERTAREGPGVAA